MLFLMISVIIFNLTALFVPKHLQRNEMYAIALFSITLGFTSDIIFDLKYNFYGYFEKGLQLIGFLPVFGLFSPAGILFMNFFPFRKSINVKVFYLLGWSIFCLVFEFFSITSGFFYHNGWKYWHSAIAYPLLLLLQLWHYNLYKKFCRSEDI